MNSISDLTEEEKQKVLEMAEQGKLRTAIAKELKIDYRKLKKFMDEAQIPIKKQGIPYEFYEPIFNLYLSGLTLQQIHDLYYPQFTTDQINYIVREKGITRRNGKQIVLNHDYFEEIDSNEKAYWLGLLFSDGNVQYHPEKGNSWTIRLGLMEEDAYLIEEFIKAVGSDREVKTYMNSTGFQRKDGKPHRESRVILSSPKMAQDLSKYGIVPRKSLKVHELPTIHEKYMSHFIRGFFDGNGSITHNKYKDKKVPRVMFYSTYDFCKCLNDYLHDTLNLTEHEVYKQKEYNVSFITYGKFQDIVNLYDYMYQDATHYMKRKKEKFELYISEYRDNHAA